MIADPEAWLGAFLQDARDALESVRERKEEALLPCTLSKAEASMKTLHPPAPLFANLLEPPTFFDDIAVVALLVLGAAPTALFLLLVVLAPPAPACVDDAGVTHVGDESGNRQAPSPLSMI
jgi:hypothetical protein